MKYNDISFSRLSDILTRAAMGVGAVSNSLYPVSDMVYTLMDLQMRTQEDDEPYFVAIREQGVEGGFHDYCLDRFRHLGYPVVLAKICKAEHHEYNVEIKFSHAIWGDLSDLEREFEFHQL